MPEKHVPDPSGATIRVLDVDGYYLPTFDDIPDLEKEVRSLPTWKARNDDLIICAYPKSGTHWLWEMLVMLKSGSAGRVKTVKEEVMMECMQQSKYDSLPSPRVLNSHVHFSYLPRDSIEKKCKIVYVVRNPKDVAISFYNHHFKILEYEYDGQWKDYLERYIKGDVDYGSWFDYAPGWEKVIAERPDHPIHVLHYEDMKEDGLKEIRRLAKFLDIEENQKLFQSIHDECSFDKMKKEKDSIEPEHFWKNKEPGMYRKGEVGDWKNWFTVAQNEYFDNLYADKMKNSKLVLRYTL